MNRTTTIFLVQGNTLKLAIPLKLRTISFSDGNAVCEDDDFIPSSDSPVTVELTDQSKKLAFEASMEGNVAVIEDRGNIPTGFYAVSVLCKDNEGNPYRFKQKAALRVVDTTEEAGITPPIEYEVKTRYLNAAIYLALKGEGGGGTVTAVKMNNDEPISPDGDGVVNLGTVLTRHQDISGKVDKVTGKGLSTEDYTSAEKAKLAGLSNYDDTALRAAVNSLQSAIDAITSGDTTTAIKTFQEVIDFLDGVTDDATLIGKLNELRTLVASKADKFMVVNITDGDQDDYYADKSFAEITAAHASGAVVAAIYYGHLYPMVNISSHEVQFMGVFDENPNLTLETFYFKPQGAITNRYSSTANVAFTGSYNDLNDKPTIPTVPTNVSAFANDAGYLTQHQDISGKANVADVYSKAEVDVMNAGLPIATTIDTFQYGGGVDTSTNFVIKANTMYYLDDFMPSGYDTAGMTVYLRLQMDTTTGVVADRTSQYVGRFTVPSNAALNLTWMSPIQMTPSAEAVLDGLVAGHVYEFNIFEGALFVADVTGV